MRKISPIRMVVLVGLYGFAANLVHPIEPTIYKNLNFPDYMFGVAFACMALTNFAFSPFWGRLCDRYGSGRVMGLCFFGYSASQYLFGICTTEWTLSLARVLAGVFISAISVGQLIYVMRYSPPEKTADNLMYMATAHAVTAPLGYLVGGFLGDRTIFGTVLAQVICLILLGLLFLLLLDDECQPMEVLDRRSLLREINPLKSFGQIRPFLNGFLVVFFTISMLTKFASVCYDQSFNYLIKAEYGFPASYNGMLKALVGVVALISNFTLCRWLLHHTDSLKSTIFILAVQMIMSAGVAVLTDFGAFIVLNVVFFGLNAVYLPLLQATLTRVADRENSGIFAGMFNAVQALGNICGSLAAGFVYAISWRLPFVLTAVLFTLTVLLAVVNLRQSKSLSGV